LARIAWHLGNRHLPVQILSDRALRVADDPTIEAMLNALGAAVRRRRAAFSPDAGAYAGAGHLPQPARTGDHD
jgi:urease accessory protein